MKIHTIVLALAIVAAKEAGLVEDNGENLPQEVFVP